MTVDSNELELPADILENIPLGYAYMKSGGRIMTPPHLLMISEHLRRVAEGEIKRLIISAPPGHGKSETVRSFCAWYFDDERFADNRILWTSYGAEFAKGWGAKVRDDINEHNEIKIRGDSHAKSRWDLNDHRGGMNTAGVNGTITGLRVQIVIIDDPIKNYKEALSKTYRNNNYEWYRSTVRDRLEPGGAIVIIMQRWHEDDLVGRILKNPGLEKWTVLEFPAIATEDNDIIGRKKGDALWPERYPTEELEITKSVLGYWWDAKFQQEPRKESDQQTQADWFPERLQLPDFLKFVRYYDMAIKKVGKEESGDYAAGCFGGKDVDLRTGILRVDRFRRNVIGIEDEIIKTIRKDYDFISAFTKEEKDPKTGERIEVRKYTDEFWRANYVFWFESDSGGMGNYSASAFQRAIREKAANLNIPPFKIEWEHPSGSKRVRAIPALGAAKGGNVYHFPGDWDHDGFIRRICDTTFEDGGEDDDMDSFSGMYSKLLGSRRKGDSGITL